jgi:hypothetical protein
MPFSAGAAYMQVLPAVQGFGSQLLGAVRPALNAAQGDFASLGKQMEVASRQSFNRAGLSIAALGAAATVAAGKAIHAAQEWGGEVRVLTRELGLSAEEASGLAFAAHHLGIETATLSKGFGIFAKNIATGNKALEENGIQTRDAQGRTLSFDKILAQTADRFESMPNGIDKTNLALQLFGRGGKALLPLLSLGAAGLRKLSEEAEHYGLVLTEDNLVALKELKFAQRDVSAAFKGFEVQLGVKLAPASEALAHGLEFVVSILDRLPSGLVAGAVGGAALAGVLTLLVAVGAGLKRNLLELGITTAAKTKATAADIPVNEAQAASLGQVAVAADAAAVGMGALLFEVTDAGPGVAALTGSLALQQTVIAETAPAAAGAASGLGGLAAAAGPAVIAIGATVGILTLLNHLLPDTEKEAKDWATSFVASLGGGAHAADDLRAKADELEASLRSQGIVIQGGNRRYREYEALIKAHSRAERSATLQTQRRIEALRDLAKEQDKEAETLDLSSDALEANLTNQVAFGRTLDELVSRGAPREFADMLRQLGDQGQAAAEQLLTGSEDNLNRVVALWQQTLPAIEQPVFVFAKQTADEFTKWKESVAGNADLVEGSLDKLAETADLSAKDILKSFQALVKAEREAAANARIVFAALPDSIPVDEFKARLAEMGPEKSAPILKALADALTSGNRKVFDAIVANIVESDRLSHTWSGEVAPAAQRLSDGALSDLEDTLRDIGVNSRIRAEVKALILDDPHIPIREFDAILKDLGVRKNLRTKIEAAVTASVRASVTEIRVSATAQHALDLIGLQGGGPFEAHHAYLVGEHGPEVAVFDEPGFIIPNHELDRVPVQSGSAPAAAAAAVGRGGGVTVNIYNPKAEPASHSFPAAMRRIALLRGPE